MADIQDLKAETRSGTGKGPAYQARQKGLIPGVIYGGANDAQIVSVDGRTLERHIEAGHFLTTLFMLDVAGAKTRVIPRDVQLDPVTDRPVHVDFLRLEKGATVKLNIPVHFRGQGESPGLKKGGVLNIARHSIVLLCPAENIPNTVEVDVAKLDIMDTVHFEDLTLPAGVKPVARGRDTTVCSIVASSSVREEQKKAAAGGDAAEAAPAAASAAPAAGAKAPAAGAKAAPAAAAKPAAKK